MDPDTSVRLCGDRHYGLKRKCKPNCIARTEQEISKRGVLRVTEAAAARPDYYYVLVGLRTEITDAV